jgi:hypothetical protein
MPPAVLVFSGGQARLPAPTYAAALVELCVRIWLELEWLREACNMRVMVLSDASTLLMKAATLRLELHILLDSCASQRCYSLLGAGERQALHELLVDVLDAIAFSPDALTCHAVERAQDRVFDEIIAQYHVAAAPCCRETESAHQRVPSAPAAACRQLNQSVS